jgi:prepilin-type processing-associated H-X9-DG protein/prepilin-type N-terminal cleavage/methylation domain-containing protein
MNRNSFTLLELLVVIAIILILMALLLVSFGKARQSAWKAACASNLHQIDLAHRMYMNDWPNPHPKGAEPSFWKRLLPYLDNNKKLFLCPAAVDPVEGEINYFFEWYAFDTPELRIIGRDDQARHLGRVNVLFNDGHIESRSMTATGLAINASFSRRTLLVGALTQIERISKPKTSSPSGIQTFCEIVNSRF